MPADGEVHTVDLTALGDYRVVAHDVTGGKVVTGLPTAEVDGIVESLIWWEVLLGLFGVLAAAGRRHARRTTPAASAQRGRRRPPTPSPYSALESGDIGVTERVPERLTDERTEVGQVGSALNTLLEHVETSLAARHRSELQVRQFVADASHELRTPLATIHGYAELSRRTPDDPAALSTALTKVETETDRMSALVEDLLLLARLDSGRPLERDRGRPHPAAARVRRRRARASPRSTAGSSGSPTSPSTVTGDEQRLHQVVTNLLGNARHHTPPGTTVTVSAEPLDSGIADHRP